MSTSDIGPGGEQRSAEQLDRLLDALAANGVNDSEESGPVDLSAAARSQMQSRLVAAESLRAAIPLPQLPVEGAFDVRATAVAARTMHRNRFSPLRYAAVAVALLAAGAAGGSLLTGALRSDPGSSATPRQVVSLLADAQHALAAKQPAKAAALLGEAKSTLAGPSGSGSDTASTVPSTAAIEAEILSLEQQVAASLTTARPDAVGPSPTVPSETATTTAPPQSSGGSDGSSSGSTKPSVTVPTTHSHTTSPSTTTTTVAPSTTTTTVPPTTTTSLQATTTTTVSPSTTTTTASANASSLPTVSGVTSTTAGATTPIS